MDVRITETTRDQKPILDHLMQLYLYDFSEVEGFDTGGDGLFEQAPLDSYWTEPDRYPFLIYVDDRIAGFILVNSHTCLHENEGARSIAEFFVMRKYRRKGVGSTTARHVFDLFPGKWEVRQIPANDTGQRFWRNVIRRYTNGNFSATALDNGIWQGPAQSFDNSDREATASEN